MRVQDGMRAVLQECACETADVIVRVRDVSAVGERQLFDQLTRGTSASEGVLEITRR